MCVQEAASPEVASHSLRAQEPGDGGLSTPGMPQVHGAATTHSADDRGRCGVGRRVHFRSCDPCEASWLELSLEGAVAYVGQNRRRAPGHTVPLAPGVGFSVPFASSPGLFPTCPHFCNSV